MQTQLFQPVEVIFAWSDYRIFYWEEQMIFGNVFVDVTGFEHLPHISWNHNEWRKHS